MVGEDKRPIHLKVRVGDTEIEIECEEDQFNRTISSILSSAIGRIQTKPATTTKSEKNVVICIDVVKQLMRDGWFTNPKTLPETTQEISRRGFNYSGGVIGHCLLDAVNKGLLIREGENRRYRYFK
jgi:hypothetical protein